MRSRYFILLSILFICGTLAPGSFSFAQNNNFYWQQQQMRQQQIMQQQRQQEMMRQQQEQMRRQQQEQMRRQQEMQRQQQLRQQEAMRQQQQRQQQMMRERQQQQMAERQKQIQQQKQHQVDQQRQRQTQQQQLKAQEQQRALGQRNQSAKQQLQQQQTIQQQRQMKDRQDRLNRLQQERLKKQQSDKRKKDSQEALTMAALLSTQQTKSISTKTQLKTTAQLQSVSQFQEKRLQQQKQQYVTKQMEAQRKAAQVRLQKIRLAQERSQTKKQLEKKLAQKQTQTQNQKLAEANFNVCEGKGCGKNKCSFHGDTLVLTKAGYKPIKSLSVQDDYVWARDEHSGDMNWKSITAHYSNSYEETVSIGILNLANGQIQTIVSNRIHPFFVSDSKTLPEDVDSNDSKPGIHKTGQWIQAQNLQRGDLLLTDSGSTAEVITLEIKDEPLKAYNLTVDEYHTYFVKGGVISDNISAVWVHNDCGSEDKTTKKKVTNGVKLSYNSAQRTWTSPAGLVYGQGSKHGNRIKHVLSHTVPNPNKPIHTVFNVKRNEVLGLIDEAWIKRGNPLQEDRGTFVVPMNKIVGTNGEKNIRIIVRPDTNEIITAFPE